MRPTTVGLGHLSQNVYVFKATCLETNLFIFSDT